MSGAELTPEGRRWLAWCNDCADGLRGPRAAAEAWQADHNSNNHPTNG